MTEKQEKEYIHWQELAEQLGADTTSEIDDYFAGTVSFSDIELDESELPDMLPELPTADVETGEVNEKVVISNKNEESDAAMPSQDATISNDLSDEIGWNSPEVENTLAEKPKKTVKPKKKMNKKPAANPESNTQPKPTTESANDNHWDFLASTLGLEESPTALPTTSAQNEASADQETKPSPVKADTSSKPAAQKTAEPTGFGAGLIDFDEIEPSEQEITQENILNEMFVASDISFEQAEISTLNADSENSNRDSETSFGFDEDDEEFVEFEVEDLDPGGRRPAGQRKPRRSRESGRRNPTDHQDETVENREGRAKKPRVNDDSEESDRPRKKRKKRADSVVENQEERRSRQRRSKQDEDESSDNRPRKRRGSRVETTSSDDRPRKRKSDKLDEGGDEESPRKRRSRRPRSDKSQASNNRSNLENYNDEVEERTEVSSRRSTKSDEKTRKLPTWADTIEVIVETNISSRKKPPKKKRSGGGRSRRGGNNNNNNRDRDRN